MEETKRAKASVRAFILAGLTSIQQLAIFHPAGWWISWATEAGTAFIAESVPHHPNADIQQLVQHVVYLDLPFHMVFHLTQLHSSLGPDKTSGLLIYTYIDIFS